MSSHMIYKITKIRGYSSRFNGYILFNQISFMQLNNKITNKITNKTTNKITNKTTNKITLFQQ